MDLTRTPGESKIYTRDSVEGFSEHSYTHSFEGYIILQ